MEAIAIALTILSFSLIVTISAVGGMMLSNRELMKENDRLRREGYCMLITYIGMLSLFTMIILIIGGII